MRKTAPPSAVAYLRVSTSGQALEGVSLDAQRQRVTAWAKASGYAMAAIHQDAGISGGKASNRPGLQAAIVDACQLRCPLVVYSLSRLARSTKDAIGIIERIEKSGADLVSLSEKIDTSSAAGKLFFRLMAIIAEFEKDIISERTSAALQYKRSQGLRAGAVPFGWRLLPDGQRLRPVESEQRALAMIHRHRQRGKTLQAICDALTRAGVRTKTGLLNWKPNTIAKILNRKSINHAAVVKKESPTNKRSAYA